MVLKLRWQVLLIANVIELYFQKDVGLDLMFSHVFVKIFCDILQYRQEDAEFFVVRGMLETTAGSRNGRTKSFQNAPVVQCIHTTGVLHAIKNGIYSMQIR